jgi:Protein of unknown function (DUF3617)
MKFSVVIASLSVACAVASAADTVPLAVKTGLWENTMTRDSGGAPMIPPEVLAKMPPEQRAKLEERIRASQGPQTTKSCITQEQLNKAFAPDQQAPGSCRRNVITSSATKQEIQVDCTSDKSKTTGTIRVEAVSSELVKGVIQMSMTGAANRNMSFNSTFTAKWLGPTCEAKK